MDHQNYSTIPLSRTNAEDHKVSSSEPKAQEAAEKALAKGYAAMVRSMPAEYRLFDGTAFNDATADDLRRQVAHLRDKVWDDFEYFLGHHEVIEPSRCLEIWRAVETLSATLRKRRRQN